jgi:hypothetical protein
MTSSSMPSRGRGFGENRTKCLRERLKSSDRNRSCPHFLGLIMPAVCSISTPLSANGKSTVAIPLDSKQSLELIVTRFTKALYGAVFERT